MTGGIDRIVTALNDAGLESANDIADAIWLAAFLPTSEKELKPSSTPDPQKDPAADADSNKNDPPKEKGSSEPPRKREDAPDSDPSKGLFLPDPKSSDSEGATGRHLFVPSAPALGESLEIGRALRPFMTRRPSRWHWVLDEAATVDKIAEERIWVSVVRPAPERWLDLTLVVDAGGSMGVWQKTIDEFSALLNSIGAFRSVSVWRLESEKGNWPSHISGNASAIPIFLGSDKRSIFARRSAELNDPSGRRLILLCSDCIARPWRDGRMADLLRFWGRINPVALVQMLPQHMWPRSGLSVATEILMTHCQPAASNSSFRIRTKNPFRRIAAGDGVPIPVINLDHDEIARWADWVVFGMGRPMKGLFLERGQNRSFSDKLPAIRSTSASEIVDRFLETSTAAALHLATAMSATPPFNLSLMRVVRQAMVPSGGQIDEAQFLLGGLVQALSSESDVQQESDAVVYDFRPGVREILLDALPVPSAWQVLRLDRVTEFIGSNLGSPRDFKAILEDPDRLPESLRRGETPFAQATMEILRRLSTRHARAMDRPTSLGKGGTVPVLPDFSRQLRWTLRRHRESILRLEWSCDGQFVATPSVDKTVCIWEASTGERIQTLRGHAHGVNQIAWSPDGTEVVTVSYDHTIRLWSVATGRELSLRNDHHADTTTVAWSPDGKTLATGGADTRIMLWTVLTSKGSILNLVGALEGHHGCLNRVVWSPDSRRLASCAEDGEIKIWNVEEQKSQQSLREGSSSITCLDWSPDGEFLAGSSFSGQVCIWQQDGSFRQVHTLQVGDEPVTSVSYSCDGRLLAAKSMDGRVLIWEAGSWALLDEFGEPNSDFWPASLKFNPCRLTLATLGNKDRDVRIWDLGPKPVVRDEPDSTSVLEMLFASIHSFRIPRWLAVAFLARFARRLVPCIVMRWPEVPVDVEEAANRLIGWSEAAAARGGKYSPIDMDAWGILRDFFGSPIIPQPIVTLAIEFITSIPGRDQSAIFSKLSAFLLAINDDRATLSGITKAIITDFELAVASISNQQWTDNSPISREFFGPLWPDGQPRQFSEHADPDFRVLVVGQGTAELPPEVQKAAELVGEMLATQNFGLVTCAWPGVDFAVAKGFADAMRNPRRILSVVTHGRGPVLPGSRFLRVPKEQDEYSESVSRSNAVIVISGWEGTEMIAQTAMRMGKPVFPLPSTGNAAEKVFDTILQSWWPDLFPRIPRGQFEQLRGPVELVVRERLPKLLHQIHRPVSPADPFFSDGAISQLQQMLPGFLVGQRWYSEKSQTISRVEVIDTVLLDKDSSRQILMCLIEVYFAKAEPQRYALPFKLTNESPGDENATGSDRSALLISEVAGFSPPVNLYDAQRDRGFWQSISQMIADKKSVEGTLGAIDAILTEAFARHVSTDQTPREPEFSSSIADGLPVRLGDQLLVKFFQRLVPANEVGLEKNLLLMQTIRGRELIPSVLATLHYRPDKARPESTPLAIASEFITKAEDGWSHAKAELKQWLEYSTQHETVLRQIYEATRTSTDAWPRSLLALSNRPNDLSLLDRLNGFIGMAQALGKRTADLHLALGSNLDNPAFRPEKMPVTYWRQLNESLEAGEKQLRTIAFQHLSNEQLELREVTTATVRRSIEKLDLLRQPQINGSLIRCHENYDLRSLIYGLGGRFAIVGFGRRSQSPAEKFSPLADVAQMIASFHYAAAYATEDFIRFTDPRPAALYSMSAYAAEAWCLWSSAAFLQSYCAAIRSSGWLPDSSDQLATLLDAHLVSIRISELTYELSNRPTFARFPLRGLQLFLAEGQFKPPVAPTI